ncbi:amino acid permease [Candidatus Babeliales bacterium]|nr:amino acid permease [Candidatus Babeliales bacterium]MBP9844177.1 amino acid permease [Candidatus Babeliales bacterium]
MSTENTQKIGLATAIIVGMNAMIGAGIFSMTSQLASGTGPASILSYLFAFFAVWFIAQSFARVAYLWPQEGSFYTYASQWGGHTLGIITAGAYIFGFLIAMALLCKIAGFYLHDIFPAVSSTNLGLITLAALVALNLLGMTLSQIGQYILIIFTVFSLLATTALCLTKIDLANLTPFMPYGPFSIIKGTRVAIFGLFGFECITSLFNIVENPEKNVPKALQYSLLLVGIIYLFFISSIILSIPATVFTSTANVTIPQALQTLFPDSVFMVHLIRFSILSAIIGTIHSMIWAGSELIVSYAKMFKTRYIKNCVQKGYITQKVGVLFCGLVMFICFMTINQINLFFTLTAIPLIFAFISSIVALLFQPSEWKSGQNIKTILGLIAACIIFGIAIQNLIEDITALLC